MKNLYYVTNGYCSDNEGDCPTVRVVIAKDKDEAEHLAMLSFKEEDAKWYCGGDAFYTDLEVHLIRSFKSGSQVVWSA